MFNFSLFCGKELVLGRFFYVNICIFVLSHWENYTKEITRHESELIILTVFFNICIFLSFFFYIDS